MKSTLEFTIDLAQGAGRLLQDWFKSSGTAASKKSDASVVTEADLAADRWITRKIHTRFPEDQVVSEELRGSLDSSDETTWIVDPLDGTTNFSLGLPFWGVSIARICQGVIDSGALFFPSINELYYTALGQGAFLNGTKIQVKPYDPDLPAAFFSCCTRTHRQYRVNIPFKTRILGSAAYSLCTVARGSALLAFEATPKIWDIAAGWLLVQEAGGLVETLTGRAPVPLMQREDYRRLNFPILAAASEKMAQMGRDNIQPRSVQA
jgi:myo-inositol-1(or 4)-monophosphatase